MNIPLTKRLFLSQASPVTFRYIQKDFASSVSIQKETILASGKFGPEMLEKVTAAVKSSDVLVVETVERFDNDYFKMISILADLLK